MTNPQATFNRQKQKFLGSFLLQYLSQAVSNWEIGPLGDGPAA